MACLIRITSVVLKMLKSRHKLEPGGPTISAEEDVFIQLARACPPGAYRDVLAEAEVGFCAVLEQLPASQPTQPCCACLG